MDCVSSSLHQFLSSSSSSSSTLLPAFLQERERSVTDHITLANQVLRSMLLFIALVFVSFLIRRW